MASTPSLSHNSLSARPILGGNSQHHSLLRFGYPDLGIRKALVLEWSTLEIDRGADLGPHLADRRAESAGAAIGDRMKEPAITCLNDDVENHFFGDGIADLDGAPGNRLAFTGELGRAEGSAMNAVAAGAAADRHDPIARHDLFVRHSTGQHADGPAKHQGIGQVPRVDSQRAVDRGNAHSVSVITNAGDDPLEYAPGMKHTGGHLVWGQIRRRHTEYIGVADRLGPEPRPERIANHAPEPCIRAAIGIDGRRMIVRLNLEADVVRVIKPDHPGVVAEDAHEPVAAQFTRRAEDCLLEQVVNRSALERNATPQRFV